MCLSRNITGFNIILLLLCLAATAVEGQTDSTKMVRIFPGEEYKAGKLHRMFFGNHWRDLWTTEINVPLLDLDNFDGGLTPLKRGGGQQTKSLRFKSNSGKEYKFRSINKDPSLALPPELHETLASNVVQDQISSANPMAPLIVSPILRSLGILEAEPVLVVMPDSKKLGEYKEEFGGLLGTIELHPDDYDDDQNFAGAEKIAGTDKLIESLLENNDEYVKAPEYLKARLADIFMGDWDRHIDQWRWARFSEGDKKYWRPIPRDRDQAFARFDGIFSYLATIAVTQLEHFGEDYYDVKDITWAGRHTDRRFLHVLTKAEWDSVTRYVQNNLTDSVIEYAARKLPPEMYSKKGEKLVSILKQRRNKLNKISDDFYYQIIKYVNIHLSNDDEYVEVKRINNYEVDIKIFDLDKEKKPREVPYYQRVFYTGETNEIRLILNDGDDKIVITGEVDESIKLFADGGKGKDTLIDNSLVRGFLVPETKTIFMDGGDKTVVIPGRSTSIKKEKYYSASEIEPPRDWGHDWKFVPWFNVNPDDGLFIGGGPVLYEFGFRRRPYVYRMELTGGYATHARRFRLRYTAEYNPSSPGKRYFLEAKTSGLEVINFYGFGNNSILDHSLRENDYYKVKQQQLYISPSVEYFINPESSILYGVQLKFSDTDEGIHLFELNPYGSRNTLLLNLNSHYIYDSRDNKNFPASGFRLMISAAAYPPVRNNQSIFYKLRSEARIYFSHPDLRLSSVALRAGGEKIWGRFPFFEAAFLGGENSLRGYDRNRFAGDASLYSGIEMRLFITDFKLFFPIYTGLTALADAGRVFYTGNVTNKIRSSWGGGIWMSIVKPEYLLSFYAARSVEDTGLYLSLGFHF